MKLSFVSKYASIDAFNDIELPELTIITGINGSGKSQLLKAIIGSNRINYQQPTTAYINVSINDDVIDKKDIYGPVSDFGISGYGFNPSANTIKIDIISKNIGNIKQNIKKEISNLAKYDDIKQYCTEKHKPFTLLEEADVLSLGEDYINYKQVINNYIKIIDEYKFTYTYDETQYSKKSVTYTLKPFIALLDKYEYSIDELDDVEIANYAEVASTSQTTPLIINDLSNIFLDYHNKVRRNKELLFYNKSEQYYAEGTGLTEDEFLKVYGTAPWDELNSILEGFSEITYTVTKPDKILIDSFQCKLESTINKGTIIGFDSLSSGEKLLMGLATMIFKLKYNDNLPKVILFDEVDSNLHPTMIKILLKVIDETLLKNKTKVIMVTHSPTMVALSPEESIYIMKKIGNNRLEKKSKNEALSILTEGLATLESGLSLLDELVQNELTVITEGRNTNYIKKALELFDCKNVKVLDNLEDLTGDSQLKSYFKFFSKVKHTQKVLFIWDCDVNKIPEDENNTYAYKFEKNNENNIAQKGIENMFEENLFGNYTKKIEFSNGDIKIEFDQNRKSDLETYILSRNDSDDFKKFKYMIDYINKIKIS
ncbi:MAG: AAA family ATPase [Arcobacteraceae bacterium]|nr:AAA family ATPase [Arcobacteraceae bacterium]